MVACSSHSPQAGRTELRGGAGVSVLELSAPAYDATNAKGDGAALRAQCKGWMLDAGQAETFFRLSKPISGEQKHAKFYDLPCNIDGRAQWENRTWNFRINAAATATLTSGDETRLLGCSDPACESLVLMMPEG